jgi:hypothetical protein
MLLNFSEPGKSSTRQTLKTQTKYVNVGQIDKLNAGTCIFASSRSVRSNCRAQKFWVQYVYTEHELS